MFASYDSRPRILRLHGTGRVCLPGDPDFTKVTALHPPHSSTRAVVVVDVQRISDSCGHGVPIMQLIGERDLLRLHADHKGPQGMRSYRQAHNSASIDGLAGLPD
jgi:hypothetical protein